MATKSICCISSKRDWQDSLQLCKRVKDKTGIIISVLNSSDSTVDFDAVLYIHSKSAIEDSQVSKWLKEASDLNKTFIPVIIGGNIISNKFLIFKYRGPNLRSSFLQLRKDDDYLELCKTLTAYVGKILSGDAYGATVNFVFDVDCKIVKDGMVIAEVLADAVTPVTLYLGTHNLTYQPDIDKRMSINEVLDIKDLEQSLDVEFNFCKKVNVSTDILCDVYQNDRLVARLNPNEPQNLPLIAGRCNLCFQSVDYQDINKILTTKIEEENCPIDIKFTADIELLSDCACYVYQDEKLMGKIVENQPQAIPLFVGKSNVIFKCVDYPDRSKEYKLTINPNNPRLITRFGAKVRILVDTNCALYQDNLLMGHVEEKKEQEMFLFLGDSILIFESQECSQYYSETHVRIKEKDNEQIQCSLKSDVKIKADVDSILKDNGEYIGMLSAYQTQSLMIYKGIHNFHIEDIYNSSNYRDVKLDIKYNRSLSLSIDKKRLLSRIEQFYISEDLKERYYELLSERKILKDLLWTCEDKSDDDIQHLRDIDNEIDFIVNKTFKEKGISDIIDALQMPLKTIVSQLDSAPRNIMGLLNTIEKRY